jgi:hypothetical protein
LDVEGIPTLALFGPDGVLITEEGALDVNSALTFLFHYPFAH